MKFIYSQFKPPTILKWCANLMATAVVLLMGISSQSALAQVSVTATAGITGPTAFTTLNSAFTAINAGVHQGVITIAIIGNTTEPATPVPLLRSFAPSSYTSISIKPSGGNWTINSAAAPTASRGIIELSGADNVTIDGDDPGTSGTQNLTIQSVTSTSTGIACVRFSSNSVTGTDGADNNTLKNCILIGSRSAATSTATNYGFVMSNATSITTGAYSSLNTIVENNAIRRCYRAIYAAGSSATYPNTGLRIRDNVIGSATAANNIGQVGIYLSYTSITTGANAAIVERNDIRVGDVSASGSGYSASISGIEVNTVNAGALISRNNIHDIMQPTTSGYGAFGIHISGSTNCNDIEISNNFINNVVASKYIATSLSSFVAYGIRYSAGATLQKIKHNTIVMPNTVTGSTTNYVNYGIAAGVSGVTISEFLNNIVVNNNVGTGTFGFYVNTTTNISGGTVNNNNYYVPSGNVGYYNAANRVSFGDWQTATGKDANGANVNPPFISASDLHLDIANPLVSGVEQKGATGTGVTVDIDGNARPNSGTTLPDMGADEVVFVTCTAAAGGAISPATQTKCAGQTATMSSVGAEAASGISYQWEVSTVGGGAGFADAVGGSGATTTSYTTDALTAGTFYYRLRVTCVPASVIGYSNELVVTVNPIPTAAISPTSAAVCGGTPVALTASGGTAYAWSPTTGLDVSNVAAVNANPSSTTTYTVTVTNTGCTSTASVAVTVTPGVSATASATPPAVCAGGSTQLNVAAVQSFTTPAAASYAFTTASGTALQTMTGATSIVASASDVVASAVTNIGFAFNFGGVSYTQFSASSNGAMGLGGTAVTSADANGSTSFPTILPAWDDMHTCTDGNVQFLLNTAGGVGNRILIVEWNYGNYADRFSPYNKRVQVWLYEGTNQIKIVYGVNIGGALSSATVGIVSSATSFNDVNTTTNTNNTASAQDANTVWPATGTTYIFTPTGAPSFTYAWSESPAGSTLAATNIANPMANGILGTTIYTVTVTGNGGCTATSSVTVSAGVALTATPTATPATICVGASTTIAAGAAGGGAPYTYIWDNGAGTGATATVSPSSTTTYNVTVTDACLATATGSVTVTVNPLPSAAITANPSGAAICGTGSVILDVPTGATTYAWLPATGLSATNTASVTASPTTTTTYTVTVTGSNGCTATSTRVVTVATAITATASATPSAICVGGNSQLNVAVPLGGAIKITEVCLNRGGTGGGVYPAFAPGADLVEITNISSSPIDISGWTLSDHASNTAAATHTGFAFPASTIIPANSVAVVCLGTGTNDVPNRYYNTGGTSDFWLSSGLVGIVLKNGSTVVDAVGCGSAYVFNAGTGVTAGDWSGFAPSGSGLAGTTRTAAVDNNTGANWSAAGVVTQTIGVYNAGFTPPPTISSYAWTPSTYIVGQESLQNPLATAVLATQTYNVVVTTSEGCTATSSVTVTAGIPLTATPTATPATICAGASTTLAAVAAGGGAPYTYLWDNGAGTGATATVSPSSTTTYNVTVTDACLATATGSITVTVNPLPTATAGSNSPVCVGADLNLTATTDIGTTFAWAGPNTFTASTQNPSITGATLAATGTYTVTVTAAGCSATATTAVVVNETPVITSVTATPATLCTGGNSQLNAVASISPYSVSSTTYGLITPVSPASITLTDDDNATVAMPFAFNFFGSSYSTAYVHSNGFVSFTSGQPTGSPYNETIPTAATPNNYIALCHDDLNVTGGGTVTHFTSGVSPNQIWVIQYTNVKFYNSLANNGVVSGQIQLYENGNRIEIHLTEITDPVASAHAVGIENSTGTVGYAPAGRNSNSPNWSVASTSPEAYRFTPNTITYAWSESPAGSTLAATNIANPMANGISGTTIYTVTVTGNGICATTSSVTVTVNALPTAGITNNTASTELTCNTTSISVTATGGTTYAWSGGATPATAANSFNAAGTYTVTVTGSNGCSSTAAITITSNTTPPTASATSTNTCAGSSNGTATVTASGGSSPYTYTWAAAPAFVVDHMPKTAAHPYFGVGSGTGYTIDGVEGKELTLVRGVTYTFDLTMVGGSHPWYITDDAVGAGAGTQYTTPSSGTTITFTPTGAMPNLLYYQCVNHPNMGWKINLVDAAAPNELTNLSAGTYTATVTGANGCTATADAVVGTTTVATPTLTITDNTCTPLAAGSISATGDLSNTLYYYTGVDATAASANAVSNTGGSTTAPTYTSSIVYVCVVDEDANGCRSAAACGQTAPITCGSCGAVAAAPTDGTNAAITFCQQGGTLTGSTLADPTTLGASYARVYLLVDNATSIIWDNQLTVAALTAPANTTSSDITYSIYSLVYSTDGFNDVVITNGVSNIIVGDPDVLTDADDNSPLEATPSANACMDLSPASAATVTVGQALIFDSSSDIICGNTSANIDLSSSIAGLQVTWTAAANPGSSITGFSNQVTPVAINALGTPDITQVLSNPSTTTNFVNYIVTAQLGSCFGDPVTIPQSVMPNLNIGITGTTCSITGYNVTFAIIGGTGGYSVTGDDGIVNHSPGDATGGVAGVPSGNTLTLTVEDNDLCTATVSTTVTVPAQPTGLSCWQTATLNPATCVWDVTGTQDPMPTGLDCWETATFNTTTCVWDVTGTQDPMPTGLDCWETATFNTTTCVWDVTGTQDPMPTGLDCWETATFNTTTCVWDVTGTQDPMPTGLDCWETATFNTTTCVWDVTGTQDPMPTGLDCWETATFNTTTCVWDVTGTQDPMPTGLDCWETATFNTTTCVWDVTGTQDPMPTGLDCWETATFNTTTCVWDVTGTQDPMPTGLDCWETATFNTTTCVWDVTGTQDPMPTGLDCWETATFNTTTCVWDVTGTQDPMPTGLDCWETATFNTTTCVWDVTGTQDPMPTGLDCWETATFNTTTCVWDVTGTQDPMPTGLDCWETATFNTTTCVWDVTGTQDPMPTGLDCWETATFNTTTCVWDVTGTQDPMPTGLDCWETATFNTTTCVWDVTGTQDPMPTGLDCWETATFNTTTCVWDVTGTQDPMPTGLDCWETATFNTTTCVWDVTGTQDPMPTGLDCWETATFNTTTCVWDVTGTQDPMPTGLDCWETATFNTTTCVWDVTGTQDPMPTGLDCWETATFNTTTCVWDVTGTQDPMPTGLDCWETATFNTTTCVWDVTGTQDPMPTGLDCWETATFNTTTCVWDVTGTQDPMPTGLDCWETATFNTTTCVWDVTGTQDPMPTGLDCWETATFNTTTCVWDVTGTQDPMPTGLDCWETATFNTTTCVWDVTGTQDPMPTGLDCWETATFNTTTCVWDVTGTQDPMPTGLDCWETATFNTTTCVWDVTGTQDPMPTGLDCWETATFNTTTCVWDVTGTQDPMPTGLDCWETATFNTTTCVWDVTGTQDPMPTGLDCWETATFNTTTCVWDVTGTQDPMPTGLDCWETATFNTTTCVWDVTGTQDPMPTGLDCWETATFNTTTCVWDVTGTQDPMPTGLDCWETATFNTTTCVWDVTGTQDPMPTGLDCWETATFNTTTCVWDVTGTQDPMPTGLDCWETATFNTTTCVWDVTGTQDPMPTGLDCWETATFNTTTCVWDVTGTQDPMPTGLDCWETATFNTTTCVWDVTGTQDPMPTGLDCWETATFNTTTCVWDVTGTQDPMPTGLDCWETATFNTTTCVWDVTGTQDPMPTGLDCWETATFNTTTCVWDVTGTQPAQPTGLTCWQTATFNTTTCVWDVTGSAVSPTASNNGPVCEGGTITLSVNPNLPLGITATYFWSGPAGTATAQNPSIKTMTPAKTGLYTVTVTYSNGCTATATTTLAINPKPVVSSVVATCVAGSGRITVTATGTSLTYNIGAGAQTSNVFNGVANGTYTVVITNATGCTATANVTVNCSACPTPVASSNSPVCTGGNIMLSVNPNLPVGVTATYFWSGPGGNATLQNPTITNATTTKAGVYTVTVTYSNGCTATASATVTLAASISGTILGPSSFCSGGSAVLTATGGGTYAWSTSATTAAITVTTAGTYVVTITNGAACKRVSKTVTTTTCKETDVFAQMQQNLSVTPNPFAERATIEFMTNSTGHTSINVYSMEGKVVATLYNANTQAGEIYQVTLDGANLPSGMYFVEMTNANGKKMLVKAMISY